MTNSECLSVLDRYEFDRIVKVLDDLSSVDDMSLNDVRQAVAYVENRLDLIYNYLLDSFYDFDTDDASKLHKLIVKRCKNARANFEKSRSFAARVGLKDFTFTCENENV